MPSGDKYSRLISSQVFLIVYLAVVLAVTFLSPDVLVAKDRMVWISVFPGLADIEYLSVPLALFCVILMILSMYHIVGKIFFSFRKAFLFSMLYAIIVLMNRSVVSVSINTISAILLIWSIYFSSIGRKSDKDIFISSLLISTATLLCPYLALLIPLIICFSIFPAAFKIRTLFISLAAVLTPCFIFFSLSHLFFENFSGLFESFLEKILNFSVLPFRISSLPELILILLLAVISVNAVLSILTSINLYKSKESSILTRMIILLVFLVLLNIVYPQTFGTFMPYLAIPLSILAGESLTLDNPRFKNRGVDLLVFLIMLIVSKIIFII